MATTEEREVCDGTLIVRTSRASDVWHLSLFGELDLANCSTFEAELREALRDSGVRTVVDMRELEFIDSTGIALLVAALRHDGGVDRLRFIPSNSPTVARVLEMTGVDERLPLADASSNGGLRIGEPS